ncbi:putative RecQ mediated genome instability protein [Dioscorea sansibarensis]
MAEAILETLTSKGWRFEDSDELLSLIPCKPSPVSVDSVEYELLNMDLRSFGGESLPDPSSLKKSSHLQGPKVLQVVSARDVYQSSIGASFQTPGRHRRLLRFGLTDGHSEVTAIEYSPIPSINEEIIPGTKVLLGSKIPIHSGILCLNSKVVTIMGGLVQSLYEEWLMSRKYSGFSRSLLRPPRGDGDGDGDGGPPPFEKLRIAEHPQLRSSHAPFSGNSDGRELVKDQVHLNVDRDKQSGDSKVDRTVGDSKVNSLPRRPEEKPGSSETRPKEVSEAVPVQNQAAAKKLLQKMSQPTPDHRQGRGHKHRLRGKEEAPVYTLDDWERRKANISKPALMGQNQDVSQDEELARQLQNQLDFEDLHGSTSNVEAEQIRMSMFNFGGSQEERNDRREFRGRGRGRGRGRKRL